MTDCQVIIKQKGFIIMNKRFISTSLSLLVSASILSACGPTLNQGLSPETTAPAQTGTSGSSNANNAVSGNVNAGATVVAKTESSAELQAAMQSVMADEADFKDTETLSANGSFQTQALEVEQSGELSATLFTGGKLPLARNAREENKPEARQKNKPQPRASLMMRQVLKAETQARLSAKRMSQKNLFLEKKAQLESNGALTVNADGTLTIDPVKLRLNVQAHNAMRKDQIKLKLKKFKEKTKDLREVAQDKKQKLANKSQAVRTSDTEEVQNADGSITTITKVEFENTNTGATRQVISTRTTLDGQLVSAFHTLEATHKNYTRTVERNVEVDADGGRKVSVKATTTWNDGKKRERSEERIVAADGAATGGGSVTVTRADGSVKTYTYSLNITSAGEVIVNSSDTSDTATAEVTVEGNTGESDVTVVVEENGEATEVSVDLSVTDAEEVTSETEISVS